MGGGGGRGGDGFTWMFAPTANFPKLSSDPPLPPPLFPLLKNAPARRRQRRERETAGTATTTAAGRLFFKIFKKVDEETLGNCGIVFIPR